MPSYAGHFVLYAVLAGLVQGALWGWNLGSNFRLVIIAVVFSSLFGISDEFHQSFVSGRTTSVADGLVDSFAATCSAVTLWFLFARNELSRTKLIKPSGTLAFAAE